MPLPRTKLVGFTFVTVGIAVYGIWALWFSTRTERPVNIPILMTIRNQPRRLPKEDFEQVLHRPIETAGLGPVGDVFQRVRLHEALCQCAIRGYCGTRNWKPDEEKPLANSDHQNPTSLSQRLNALFASGVYFSTFKSFATENIPGTEFAR